MAGYKDKTKMIKSDVPRVLVKIENISEDFSESIINSKGDAMKRAIHQNRLLNEEMVKNFFEQLRVRLKSKLETPLKVLIHEPTSQPLVIPTPLPRTMTNGYKPNLRRSRSTSSIDRQNKKPKLPEFFSPLLPLITPKVQPDDPSIVYRRPKKGEAIMSMQGSPLLANSANSAITTINIPLNNGNVMSLLPVQHPVHLPSDIDENTKGQLQTLCGHLKQFIDKLE